MKEIKHFKLANGEEVICEVVNWDTEETRDIIIRKALKIEPKNTDPDSTYKYYTFTPWMAMQTSLNTLQTLNSDQIVSVSTPSDTALDYFSDVCEEVTNLNEQSEEVYEYEKSDSAMSNVLIH